MESSGSAPARAGAVDEVRPPDWAAIKRDYERGFEPATVLAVRHGVNVRVVHRMAYHHKWRRLALEGANANAVEVSVGAMTVDLQRSLRRQLRGLSANLSRELGARNKKASDKLEAVNAAMRSLGSAIRVMEKVVSLNKGIGEGLAALKVKNGGDDARAEFERRLAHFAAAAEAADISGQSE